MTAAVTAVAALGLDLPPVALVVGVTAGVTYGLLGIGVILVYRSNRIVNFAHGEMGAFAAAMLTVFTARFGLPYWVAFVLALLLGASAGLFAELLVVRRLRQAPKVMSVVATLGVGQFLLGLAAALSTVSTGLTFPKPPGLPEFRVNGIPVGSASVAMLLLAPVLVVAITLFLRKSRVGVGMRAAAANPDAAWMAAISPNRMSALAWAMAGAVSAFTAVLVAPRLGLTTGAAFGPSLLVRALAVAVVAGMTRIPVALGAGVVLGVLESVLQWNSSGVGVVDLSLFLVVLAALALRRDESGGREREKGSWAAVTGLRPLPAAVRAVPAVRRMGVVTAVVAFGIAILLPLVVSHSASTTLTVVIAYSVVGLSLGIVTGLGGQLSLGQFALAAVGATVSYHVAFRTGNYGLSLLYAGLAAGAASLFIGLPALRTRGMFLAVTTLAFAVMVPAWLLEQQWMLGGGVDPGRPIVAGVALDDGKRYYVFALAVFALVLLVARNVWQGGFGRLLRAVRDNEDNARAFTVRAGLVKVQGFVLAGFLAGVGGALFGHALSRVTPGAFLTAESVSAAVLAVVGGLGVLVGPVLGALYVVGVPAFLPLDAAGLAATHLGALVLILYLPGGLVQLAQPVRDRLALWLARRHGVDTSVDAWTAPRADDAAPTVQLHRLRRRRTADHAVRPPRPPGTPLLTAVGLTKRFGGVAAVDDVSLAVAPGEIVGLIGPNGAGKTTLFELLVGFTRPDGGRVLFDGVDVSAHGPENRARAGLIRSFQDAALFPTMTVRETLMVAMERSCPTTLLESVLGSKRRERVRMAEADELLGFMGLDAYRDRTIRELSTGTRRITELACMIALGPTLLLLDEPAAGIAQRETEALGVLLRELQRALGVTLVVIEHDIPMIMGMSDRIIAMEAGRVIAEGAPEVVRHDRRVVEAYLGGSIEAIERSGAASVPATAT